MMKSDINKRWEKFISPIRLRGEKTPSVDDVGNEFMSDYYRVVFSSSFRRLQDKTQVNPLATTDFVRKRLTHSFEVSVIGERMARVIAEKLKSRIGDGDYRDKFGKIVATACLLHDIGNPPFGHEGELAIRKWSDDNEINLSDYRAFDGNAQGFRIAVRLQHHGKDYGLNLTAATLSSTLKYPNIPKFNFDDNPPPPLDDRGKSSVFVSEKQHFDKICELVGLSEGHRHPLSYIVESADDIVNRLVDIEDAMKLNYINYSDICDLLESHSSTLSTNLLDKMEKRRQSISIGNKREREIWAYQDFRVNATKDLAIGCENVFVENVEAIEEGKFKGSLVKKCEYGDLYSAIKKLEYSSIFGKPDIVRIEVGGKTAMIGLLNTYLDHLRNDTKLAETLPVFPSLMDENEDEKIKQIRKVVDYVSGMTDRYAISQFQELSGVSL